MLAPGNAGALDQLEPTQPVGIPSSFELVEPGQLVLADGDDQLTRLRMDDAVCIAERPQHGGTAGAEPRLERTRLVIDSRVYHAAIVPTLMGGNPRFLFEHNDPNAGPAGSD